MTIIPLGVLISLLGCSSVLEVQPAEVLPGTSAPRLQGDLSLQVREAIDQFLLLEIDRSVEKRQTATLGMFALAGLAAEDPPTADKFPIDPGISCAAASEQPPSEFRIQLSSEQEKRAASLYRKSIVITAHDHCVTGADFRDTARAGISARVIKPIVDGHYPADGTRYPIEAEVAGWQQRGRAAIALMQKRADESGGRVRIIRNASDIEHAKRDGAQGIIVSFEGGRPLQGRLENLTAFYDLGLRELQLHWAVPSPLKNLDGTLSPFAEDVIREMDRLGIVLDLSHMPERTFGRALEITRNPVVISHCGVSFAEQSAKPGTDHLDDATIRRIASTGGVICLHFYEGYIHPRHGTKYPTLADLVDHMDRIKQVAGTRHIGLGPDYTPMKGWRWVEGAERFEDMPNVVREMVRRGYTDEEIEGVLGLNLLRVYRQVWKR